MQKKSVNFIYLFTLSLAGALLLMNSGCTGKSSGDAFGSLNVPTTPSPAPTTPPTFPTLPEPPAVPVTSSDPSTVIDQAAFRVGLQRMVSMDGTDVSDDYTLSYVHAKGSFTAPCAISADVTSSQDLECIIEVPEGDVYFKDLSLDFNLPNNMCRYMQTLPYWFYKVEVGQGPSALKIVRKFANDASGEPTIFQGADCAIDGVSHDCTSAGTDPHPEVNLIVNPVDQQFQCIYDKSGVGEPNCCMGRYTASFSVKNTTTGIVTPGNSINGNWGGDYASCIGGPGSGPTWTKFDRNHLPLPFVESAGIGFHKQFQVTAPAGTRPLPLESNMMIANYYTPALNTHHGFVATSTTSTKPYFVDPIDDLDGSAIKSGNDAYEFKCLDSATEVKHRIRVYIREWDTYPDYLAYLTTGGVVENPDRASSDVESGDCSGVSGPCGDFMDADNIVNMVLPDLGYPASYGTASTDNSKRSSYFPGINF